MAVFGKLSVRIRRFEGDLAGEISVETLTLVPSLEREITLSPDLGRRRQDRMNLLELTGPVSP